MARWLGRGLRGGRGTLGIQARTLPFAVARLIQEEFPDLKLVEAGPALLEARAIKTAREIELLKRASHVADVGHNTLARLAQTAGQDEFDMWAEITARMFETAGHEVPVVGELVTGERTRTVEYPNGPRKRITQPGDAALMDISQRIDGYWSDCTNTHVIGGVTPTAEQRRYAKASQDACDAAMAALRPGARACDAWSAAERAFRSHGLEPAHYAGHQIGVTVNEPPRLVVYDQTVHRGGHGVQRRAGRLPGSRGHLWRSVREDGACHRFGPVVLSKFAWGVA